MNVSTWVPSAATATTDPSPPDLDQIQLGEHVHDVGDRLVQPVDRDVPARRGRKLVGGDTGNMPGGLRWAEVRAVRERGQDVTRERVLQLRIRARRRGEPAPPLQ